MIRTALLGIIIAGFGSAACALAQGGGEYEDSRYSFTRTDEGYLRLDGRTGQVSLCTRRPVGWACQVVPDERLALEAEITRLQGENVALKRELIAHNLALPSAVKQETPIVQEPVLQLPGNTEIGQVVVFIEKVWKRLVEMVTTLQKDVLRKS
jgi:hypothetical protein